MLKPRFGAALFWVGLTVLGAGSVSGQNYPNRPIHIVTSGVGSAADFVARVVSQGLAVNLGQPVIVDNRSSSLIPGQIVAQAPPDGYSLLVHGATFWIGALMRSTPYDPVKDFAPITLATSSPNILVVHPSLPVKSVKELIALARAKPGELNYGSTATGSSSHLAGELFKSMAGINIVWVPYTNNAIRVADMLSGQVQLMFPSPAPMMPHVKLGRLRALAVTSLQPSALAPDLPTVAASGLPGYESVALQGMFAPAKTPAAIINGLNQELVRVLNRTDVKEKCLSVGLETVGSSPDQFAATIKSEISRMGKVIKDAGIKAD